jgi:hypothetical protein
MSLSEFANRMKNRPDGAKGDEQVARDRRPFHDLWLRDVYPYWAAPLATIRRTSGIARTIHAPLHAVPPAVNWGQVVAEAFNPSDVWILVEELTVETVAGVSVAISYLYGGDTGGGVMARLASYTDNGQRTIQTDTVKSWSGSVEQLVDIGIADAEPASALLGPLLVQALDHQEARLEAERKAAEDARAAAARAEKERLEAETAEKKRKEEAALAESSRLEAEAKARREVEADDDE